MTFNTPSFWYEKPGIKSALLMPAAICYRIGFKLAQKCAPRPYKSNLPVICVGNAVMGGGGKTPSVHMLAKICREYDIAKNPCILMRGYGGAVKNSHLVNIATDSAATIGDEAMMMAAHWPVIISPDRGDGAKLAEKNGYDLILMDDGLLNNTLAKDMTFMVIDRQLDFGNNRLFPAGPLRAPLKTVLDKTDAVLTIGPALASNKPVFSAAMAANELPVVQPRYIAFSGIAWPDKFFATLKQLELNIIATKSYPDHYAYSQKDIQNLQNIARQEEASLITTEKDAARLPQDFLEETSILKINLLADNEGDLVGYIKKTLDTA